MNYSPLDGLIAAPFTPFTQNGALDIGVIERYAPFLKEQKVAGAFVAGTTGEGMLMTVEERKRLTEAWMRHQDSSFKVIVHVGATSYGDASALAAHAQSMGVHAISTMGPLFLRPPSLDQLISYCQEITSAAPETPFYYYHIPQISGVHFFMRDFLAKAAETLPSLVGIKYTDGDIMDMSLCMTEAKGKWNILYGQDETLLAGLALGAKGAVGSTYNYLAPLYHKIITLFDEGHIEEARVHQQLSMQFVRHLITYGGGVAGGKPLMKLVGIDCGPVRSPARNIPHIELKTFHEEIKNLGLFDYLNFQG